MTDPFISILDKMEKADQELKMIAKTEAKNLEDNHDGCIIGSYGLELHEYRDFDIAIHQDNLPDSYKEFNKINMGNYFNVIPMGNNFLIRPNRFLDILVFENQDVLDAVVKALIVTKQVPKLFLKDKETRIYLYEKALQYFLPE